MLAVSTFPGPDQNETKRVQQQKEVGEGETDGGYDDFSCLLPVGLEFDDFFLSIDDTDLLPDLEMCPELLHEFHVSQADLELNSDYEGSHHERVVDEDMIPMESENKMNEIAISFKDLDNSSSSSSSSGNDGERKTETSSNKKNSKSGGGRAKSGQSKGATTNQQGKRKVKVDWTPDLHRRFVQAVEQLGVDKAVPSRILELMGIDSLTRHNIASHLQKYRSHRKHLLAREAEAASWSQRRQASYGGGAAMGVGCKREAGNPWVGVAAPVAPLAFPTPPPSAPPTMQPFRPLHVWGHPTVDVWLHSPPPWAMTPASLQTDPKFWNQRFAPGQLISGLPDHPAKGPKLNSTAAVI